MLTVPCAAEAGTGPDDDGKFDLTHGRLCVIINGLFLHFRGGPMR